MCSDMAQTIDKNCVCYIVTCGLKTHLNKAFAIFGPYTAKKCGVKITPPVLIEDHTMHFTYTTGVNRGPHHAFYTGVKFVVLVQHPMVLF